MKKYFKPPFIKRSLEKWEEKIGGGAGGGQNPTTITITTMTEKNRGIKPNKSIGR